MSKFNVGDMVRVRDWEDMVEEYGFSENGEDIATPGLFVTYMKSFCGNTYKITDVREFSEREQYRLDNCDTWVFTNETLRLVERNKELEQANILFTFSDAGVRVADEFAVTNKGDNTYIYTSEDKKKMIQALADYFNVEINFLTRNCSADDEVEDVPLEIINEVCEPYNGKVVCVKEDVDLTIGKIYDIVCGSFIDDGNMKRPSDGTLIYKDDFWFIKGYFIPLAEE